MRIWRYLLLLAALACADAHAADGDSLGLKPGAGGIDLKLQRSLVALPADSKDELPLFISGDSVQGHQDREIEAEGLVRLRRRGQAMSADWLRYDAPENEVNARGNILLEQRGDVLRGARLRLNLDTERGALDAAQYEMQTSATRGHGKAERIDFEGPGKYRAESGDYSTCDVGAEDWFVRASDLEIDKGRQLGTARNASVVFLGQTILYVPYLSFSLDRQRKSGFLSPTMGSTGNSGIELSIPYYWNIAPNMDATVTPRLMSKRGLMLSNEFRYLEPNLSGLARFEALPSDRVKHDDNRYAFTLLHNQALGMGWNGNLNIQKVSDDNYFTDLSTQIAATSQTILPRSGTISKGGTWGGDGTWNAATLVQRWQTLQTDPANPVSAPYNRTGLAFNAAKQNLGALDFDLNSSFDDFAHTTLTNGRRAVAYPRFALPLQTPYAYLTPRAGMHLTRYSLDQNAPDQQIKNRSVPIFSTDSGMVFERTGSLYGQSVKQTLEPRLYYVYIPTRAQNQLPNFDSALQDINFATLYSENQYSGSDRINDANQLTAGLTSRALEAESGVERFRVGVAQRYYFKKQDVVLPGVTARSSSNSDLLAVANGTIAPHWTIDAGWQYSTDMSQTQRINSGVRYQPEPGKTLNLTYRYINGALLTTNQFASVSTQNNTLRQIDVSTQWPLSARMSFVGRWNYSVQDAKLVEGLAGIEYSIDCWAIRVVAHSFATAATNQVTSIFLQLELNGLSKIGSNPLDLLRRNITGYTRQEAQPTRTGNVYP